MNAEKFASILPRDLLVVNGRKKYTVDVEQSNMRDSLVHLTGPRGGAALLMLNGERLTLLTGWGSTNTEHRVSSLEVADVVA